MSKRVRCAPHVLPPCRVCGQQAKGFHYGVNTCDACKGFFQRSLSRKNPYKCVMDETADWSQAIKTCSHCRYNRCLRAGMSRDAIKIGRYSYEKRSQDVLELRKMEQMTYWCHLTAAADDDNETTSSVRRLIHTIVMPQKLQSQWKFDDVKYQLMTNDKPLTQVEEIGKLLKQTKCVTSMKLEHHNCTLTLNPTLMNDQFNQHSPLHSPAKSSHHIDPIQHHLLPPHQPAATIHLRHLIFHVVDLAKRVPGFQLMTQHDQLQVIKRSLWEIWIVAIHRQFDGHLFRSFTGITTDLSETLDDELTCLLSTATRRLRSLRLTDTETTILKAFILLFTDGMELDNPIQVEMIQHHLLQALCYLYSRHKDTPVQLQMGRTIAALTELRSASIAFDSFSARASLNSFQFFL